MASLLFPSLSLSLFLFSFLLSLSLSTAASVVPSNNSAQLAWTDDVRFRLLPSNTTLVPLTDLLVSLDARQLAAFNISGSLVGVDASSSLGLDRRDIALVSCDNSAYPGDLEASQTVTNVVTALPPPSAVVLYTSSANYCNYSSDDPNSLPLVFSLLNRDAARPVESQLSEDVPHSASIVPMSFVTATNPSPPGDSGDDPNAVAMIILYSITGIITALFLGIIITGAVRAHRHPERYGPRYTPGRPRQSRARGVARAMVETIPIVKFGDSNGGQQEAKGDVELAMDPDTDPECRQENTESEGQNQKQKDDDDDEPADQPEGNFACPICTDDFVKGQDLRVLPCNHSFHPDCIDPWLVNVSGTCPLCRIDLNPEQEEADQEEAEPQDGQDGPGEPSDRAENRHRGIATYLHHTLNERRMREASVEERLAALRRVREANREGVSEEPRRPGLTGRLRERFRIRTRAHGSEGT